MRDNEIDGRRQKQGSGADVLRVLETDPCLAGLLNRKR
jgi:hypothetical protein